MWPGVRRAGRPRQSPPLTPTPVADLLGEKVEEQWTKEAADRRLLAPEPIPVRWHKPSVTLAGPVSAAVRSQRFPPLPGLSTVGQQRLRAGHLRDLHEVYGGLGSGRLVIAGAPGSGKSGAAVLLVLAALNYRRQVSDDDRPQVPVPVMFSLSEWDPGREKLQDWLCLRIQQTYPLFAGKGGAVIAARLLTAGKMAVILDGLDEIPTRLRPVALRALSEQATFRMVVLTRSAEMVAAVTEDLLDMAAAVELQDVAPSTAADYLSHVQRDPAPQAWGELLGRLRSSPDSAIARALSSPLTLTLIRDTYRGGDDVREFLNFCDAPDHRVSDQDIVDHLLDRVLPASYAPRPGQPRPVYDLQTASVALIHIAGRMNQDGTRDLQWWLITSWLTTAPSIIVIGLGFGLIFGLSAWPAYGLVTGLVTGLFMGFFAGLTAWGVSGEPPNRIAPIRWRRALSPWTVVGGIGAGIGVGILYGLVYSDIAGLIAGLTAGLALTLLSVTEFGSVTEGDSLPNSDGASSMTPLTAWRSDQVHALVLGLVSGLAFWLVGGVMHAIKVGYMSRIRGALGDGFVGRIVSGFLGGIVDEFGGSDIASFAVVAIVATFWITLMFTTTLTTSLTFARLTVHWHIPIRLMRLLEDARDRNVLRTVGPVYQFRHARLQDRLAEQAPATKQALAVRLRLLPNGHRAARTSRIEERN